MNFILNGKTHTHNGDGSLTSLLSEVQADKQQVAVMINNEIAATKDRGNILLQDGDQIEIITYAAGG